MTCPDDLRRHPIDGLNLLDECTILLIRRDADVRNHAS